VNGCDVCLAAENREPGALTLSEFPQDAGLQVDDRRDPFTLVFCAVVRVARMATLDFRISSRCMFFISWSRVTSNQPCLLQNLITSESGTFRSGWPVSSRNHSGNR
jgi:hypothetical protein